MEELITILAPMWYKYPGATEGQIQQLEHILPFQLPEDYKTFLKWSNGGEGQVGNMYISLWNIDEIAQLNSAYKINFYLPKILGISSDGGPECCALDYSANPNQPSFIKVPFGALAVEYITVLGSSFYDGLKKLLTT